MKKIYVIVCHYEYNCYNSDRKFISREKNEDGIIKFTNTINEAIAFDEHRIAENYLVMVVQNKKISTFGIKSFAVEQHFVD